MTPAELLAEVAEAGLHVDLRPDGMLFLRPRERVTPELVERLRAAKPELVQYLRHQRLMQEAADDLRSHPQRERAVRLDPDNERGTTYTAGIAVRMAGGIAVAVMTGIRTPDPFALIEAMQTACEGCLQ